MTSGQHRLVGSKPQPPLEGKPLWNYNLRAKRRGMKGKRLCLICSGHLSTYNPNDVCWSHDYEETA